MEKVVPVELSGSSPLIFPQGGKLSNSGFKLGKIEKILEPGRYLAVLENGVRVTVRGPRVLKVETPVRVFPSSRLNENPKGENTTNTQNLQENRAHLSALIPLAFGGKKALARLQIFVERKTGATRFKNTPAVYFVFFVRTENQGDLQWSVYLKERQISLQVFAEGKGDEKEELKSLIGKVEKSLKNRGFILLAPTVLLTHPFRIPEGFQMNVRG